MFVTSSSSILQLYKFLVHMKQTGHQQQQLQCNTKGKITECWFVVAKGIFFVILPSTEGKITYSWFAEHDSSTFCWFLHF